MRMAMTLAAFALLASGGTTLAKAKPSGHNAPNLAACAHIKPVEGTEIQRTTPIVVPRAWSGIVRTDMTRMAVSTLGGQTHCIDASWIEEIHDPELSPGGRFVRFGWYGNEAGGYFVVDRSGAGIHFDTGVKPAPSPSGNLGAAVEYSESGFGSLNGFGVWQVGKQPMRELARLSFPDGLAEWRMDGWHGEACVLISALRFEDLPQNDGEQAKGPRQRFVAAARKGNWRIAKGGKAVCPKS